jgi:hypothetical protein
MNEITRSKPFALASVDLNESSRANLATQFLYERIVERGQGVDDVGVEQFQQRPPVPRNLSTRLVLEITGPRGLDCLLSLSCGLPEALPIGHGPMIR